MLDDEFWESFLNEAEGEDDNFNDLDNSEIIIIDMNSDQIDWKKFRDRKKETTQYKLLCWKDTILNHEKFKKSIISLFIEMGKGLSKEELEEAGKSMAFNKAWEDIKGLDLDDLETQKEILLNADSGLVKSLEIGISYFEIGEDYEKCAFLLKILRKIQEIPN